MSAPANAVIDVAALPPPSAAAENRDLALYVHWPFCRHKCPYCDFNSHVRESVDQARWRCAYLAELEDAARGLEGRTLASLFFGGGTPSLMAPETVAAVIARARELFRFRPDIEITLEANPTSVEAGRFRAYKAAGVNRLSLGVQALDDRALRFLGRQHSVREARTAFDLARAVFPRVSFDLIYARPGQSAAGWRRELDEAIAMAADHLSLYQLTLEEGTPFFEAARRSELSLPDEERAACLFEMTGERLAAAGLPAYEISNHAIPGGESRHNLAYWRYGDYLGIGPGAHGRVRRNGGKRAETRHRRPETWLARVEATKSGLERSETLDARVQATECLMMGLRLAEGVPVARVETVSAAPLFRTVSRESMDRLEDLGLLAVEWHEGAPVRLTATAAGRQRLNAVLAELLHAD